MEITTDFNVKDNLRVHRAMGEVSKPLLEENLNRIYSNPVFQPDMDVLWDFTRADLSSFSMDAIKDIAIFVKKKWNPRCRQKAAFVSPDVLTNLITRKYAKEFKGNISLDIKVFKSQEEALSWLR